MSHIEYFKIEGLAGNDRVLELNLNRSLNVFYGLNGAGKTSLLRILHSAMSDSTSSLHKVPFTTATVDIYSEHYGKTFRHTLSREELINDNKQVVQIDSKGRQVRRRHSQHQPQRNKYWHIEPDNIREPGSGWHHIYLPTTRIFSPAFEFDPYDLDSDAAWDNGFEEHLKASWAEYYSELLQSVQKTQDVGLGNILKLTLQPTDTAAGPYELSPDEAYNRTAAFLKRQFGALPSNINKKSFNTKYASGPHVSNVIQEIVNTELKIERILAPKTLLMSLLKKLFGENKVFDIDGNNISVTDDRASGIPLNSLSSGEKHILTLLIKSLSADISTLFIDEPELSLHVDWQVSLVESLQTINPSAQFIMATHSPEILASIDDEFIISLLED